MLSFLAFILDSYVLTLLIVYPNSLGCSLILKSTVLYFELGFEIEYPKSPFLLEVLYFESALVFEFLYLEFRFALEMEYPNSSSVFTISYFPL